MTTITTMSYNIYDYNGLDDLLLFSLFLFNFIRQLTIRFILYLIYFLLFTCFLTLFLTEVVLEDTELRPFFIEIAMTMTALYIDEIWNREGIV